MALIKNPVLGNISGSVGGIVFYAGKSGQTLRIRNNLINKQSLQQINARVALTNAAQLWSTLDHASMSSYNTFALTNFVPLKKTNMGQYSGYNAFLSMQQCFTTAIGNILYGHVFWDGGLTEYDPTIIHPARPIVAPSGPSVKFDLVNTDGNAVNLHIVNPTLSSVGLLIFRVTMDITSSAPASQWFVSSNGEVYTIGLYMSEPFTTLNKAPKNKYMKYLGNMYFGQGCPTKNWTNSTTCAIHMDVSTQMLAAQYTPYRGQRVRLSFIITSVSGCVLNIGSFDVQLP